LPRTVKQIYAGCKLSLLCGVVILIFLCPQSTSSSSALESHDGLPTYIDEYSIPTPNAGPLGITVDKHGIVWFTESNVSKIGRFDPQSNSFKEYLIPGVGDMWGIIIDQSGYVWFTQYSGRGSVNPGGSIMAGGHGRLGRLNATSANVTFVDIPTVGSFPFRLIGDQENRIWFTELLGNRTGVFDQKTGKLTEYEVSKNLTGPSDLTLDQQGSLWFTEAFAGGVVRFNPESLAFTEFPLLPQLFSPVGISIDKDGHVWVADHGGNWIADFDPQTKTLVRYPTHMIQGDLTIPNGLLIDSTGRVWFSEHVGNSIGYFDPKSQTMVEFKIPTGPVSSVLWISQAPNGDVWFTEWGTDKIGVVHTNTPIPLSLQSSQKYLNLHPGEETSITLTIGASQDIRENVTLQYSWGTYNPNQVTVQFSPQLASLIGSTTVPVQVNLKMSTDSKLGNYTLSLGVDAGNVMVWTMVQLQVIQGAGWLSSQYDLILVAVSTLVLAGVGALLFIRRTRRRAPR
jgi:virginiamycin B lyase